jgi:hypothetical protein
MDIKNMAEILKTEQKKLNELIKLEDWLGKN